MLTVLSGDLLRLRRDPSGATAIEYAFIVLLIALVLIVTLISIGTSVSTMFQKVANAF